MIIHRLGSPDNINLIVMTSDGDPNELAILLESSIDPLAELEAASAQPPGDPPESGLAPAPAPDSDSVSVRVVQDDNTNKNAVLASVDEEAASEVSASAPSPAVPELAAAEQPEHELDADQARVDSQGARGGGELTSSTILHELQLKGDDPVGGEGELLPSGVRNSDGIREMDGRLGGEGGNRRRRRRKGNRVRRAKVGRGGGRSAKMRRKGRNGMDLMAGGTGAERRSRGDTTVLRTARPGAESTR